MNLMKKIAFLAVLSGLVAQIPALAESTYWQEFKAFKENPDYGLIFDKDAAPAVREIAKDIENAKEVGYWARVMRPLIGMVNGVVITPKNMPKLYAYIDTLCKENNIDTPVITVTQYKGIFNAAAQKLFATTGAIFIGQDMLKEMNDKALEAIVAHEIGHIYHNHVNKALLLKLTVIIAYTALVSQGSINIPKTSYASLNEVIKAGAFRIFADSAQALIIGKSFERQADEFASHQANRAQGIVEAFEYMAEKEQKYDASFEKLHTALENAKPALKPGEYNSLVRDYNFAQFRNKITKAHQWLYHNTPYGPHPSNEARIESAKRILAEQQQVSLPEDAQQEVIAVAA